MKSLLLTICRAAVSIRNRRAESWERRGRLHRIGEAAPQRWRRPMLQQRDPFRRQRGRVLENNGEGVVDGDHGVLGAVVVLHGGVCAVLLSWRVRVLGVSLFVQSYSSLDHSCGRIHTRSSAAALELLEQVSESLQQRGSEAECVLPRALPYTDVEIAESAQSHRIDRRRALELHPLARGSRTAHTALLEI